ncbi:MAG: ABC transporter permease [Desulfobacteraceae bacterium]|nr:MAG: ABC transporter permease [Desulfobacteraceae bacterium]
MFAYVLKRLLSTLPVLFGISLIVFILLRSLPGDPAQVRAGELATQENVEAMRAEWGLDKPIYVQYGIFLRNLVRLDLGKSARTDQPVLVEIWSRLPNTVLLAVVSIALACLLGIPAGIFSAVKRYTPADYVVMVLALFGISMPVFWLGLMLIILFAVKLHWLPAGGIGSFRHVILPAFTLAVFSIAFIARMTRSSMLEVMSQDYVTTARSKGLLEKVVILKHALRNAFIPVITVIGLQFGSLLGGAILTETVYAWPGIGRLIVDSIQARDYNMVQGIVLVFACLYIMVNLIVDILYAYIDPRIHYD